MMAPATMAALFASACSDGPQNRIALTGDTLVINGPRPIAIPAHVVNSAGQTLPNARLTYSSTSGIVRVSTDGHVACAHAGDAVVAISRQTSEARMVVLCRPIRSFGLSGGIGPLWVGGPPIAIMMTAFDSAGKPVTPLRGAVQIRDDSIARIINGRVYALARGHTTIDMDFAGIATSVPVKVVELAVHDSVHLVGGELQSWRLSPGYYEVQLALASRTSDSTGLELGAFHARCARAPVNRGQHYFCTLREGASFVVRNLKPIGSRSKLDGELIAYRQP